LVEIESFNSRLQNFNYLLSGVLSELGCAGSHLGHVVSIVHLLISLSSVWLIAYWNSNNFAVPIFGESVTEEDVKCAVFKDNNEFI